MGSSNDEREKIQRLNEHNAMPIKLIGGNINVFTTVCHISKPNSLIIDQEMAISMSHFQLIMMLDWPARVELTMFFFKLKFSL